MIATTAAIAEIIAIIFGTHRWLLVISPRAFCSVSSWVTSSTGDCKGLGLDRSCELFSLTNQNPAFWAWKLLIPFLN